MKFTKMQGAGNDYIYVNCFEEKVSDPESTAVKVSDRHFGIGSDGLVLIEPSDKADFKMVRPKADGGYEMVAGHRRKCAATRQDALQNTCVTAALQIRMKFRLKRSAELNI